MSKKNIPLTGYDIQWMFVTEQHYELILQEDVGDWPPNREITVTWEWFPSKSAEFLIQLRIAGEPSRADSSSIRVAVVARFTVLDIAAAVPFEHFVVQDGPMMMFPLINEIVGSLTKLSFMGAETISANQFAKELEVADFATSTGLLMLKDDPHKAAALGIRPDLIQEAGETRKRKPVSSRSKSTK